METPAYSSAMDDDELIFDRYSKTAIRCIKDPIYDQSMVATTSSPYTSYTTLSLALALVPICLTLSRFIDTYVILCVQHRKEYQNFVQETISAVEEHQTAGDDFVCLALCLSHSIRTLAGQVVTYCFIPT